MSQTLEFQTVAMNQLPEPAVEGRLEWLWEGYLARGTITLLTSQWKSGKTTLLTGLLRHLECGETFLGQPCRASRTILVSEESPSMWQSRLREIPLQDQVQLLSRPFPDRPTPEQWNQLVDFAVDRHNRRLLDLFVVDPLASFLPGRTESDPSTIFGMLHPLRRNGGSPS
jgi:AAA domain